MKTNNVNCENRKQQCLDIHEIKDRAHKDEKRDNLFVIAKLKQIVVFVE